MATNAEHQHQRRARSVNLLEALVDQLEEGWRRGCPPSIEALLATCSGSIAQGERQVLVRELVLTDLEFRVRAGERVCSRTYLERYPELADDKDALSALAAQCSSPPAPLTGRSGAVRDSSAHASPAASTAPALGSLGCDSQDGKVRRLGKFELLEPLGSGSFGEVYRARDTQLARYVALKIPRHDRLITADGGERFVREARHTARLRHSGIVPVFEAGTVDGTYYLACALAEGGTLRSRLNEGPLPYRQSAEIVAEVAGALDYAHREGIIHRDVKPANILFDSDGRPCLADFGLAKSAMPDATQTLDGARTGTPAFMSPEQIVGENRGVDGRSDVYSLGVVLYELLTGQLPFLGRGRMLEIEVLNDEPRPPRRLDERVPIDLESICLKAMTKEPSGRYASAADMAADLRCYLAGEPVVARPVGRCRRAARWCRRRPALAGLGSALVITVVAGFAGITSQWWRAEAHLAEANQQRMRAERNFDQAHQTLAEMMHILEKNKPTAGGGDTLRREIADGVLRHHRSMLDQEADDPAFAAALYDARCEIASICASTPEKRHTALEEAIGALRAFDRLSDVDQVWARTLSACHMYSIIGQLKREAGQIDQAVLAFQTSEQMCSDLLVAGSPPVKVQELQFTMSLQLAELAEIRGQSSDAMRWASRVRNILELLAGDVGPDDGRRLWLVHSYQSLAELLLRNHQSREAKDVLQEARALFDGNGREGEAHEVLQIELAKCEHVEGLGERERGRPDQALAAHRRGLALTQGLFSRQPTALGVLIVHGNNLCGAARASNELGDPSEAIRLYQQSATVWQRLAADWPKDAVYREVLAVCHHSTGNVHRDLGQVEDAVECYRRAIPLRRELCESHPAVVMHRANFSGTLYNLGEVLERLGRLEEAFDAYEEAADHEHLVAEIEPDQEKWRKRLIDRQRAVDRLRTAFEQRGGVAAAAPAVSP